MSRRSEGVVSNRDDLSTRYLAKDTDNGPLYSENNGIIYAFGGKMAKVTAKPALKTKKANGIRISPNAAAKKSALPEGRESERENGELLVVESKPFSDSLNRIREQAKDWGEEPNSSSLNAKIENDSISREFPSFQARPPIQRSAMRWPLWTGVLALVLLTLLTAQTFWLSWQAVQLTRSLERLNVSVGELKEKVEVWSDAETQAQIK